MPRIDLPEIEDQAWCPGWLRNAMTGYLQTVIRIARPYDGAAEPLSALIRTTGSAVILDLASGAGGPWPVLISQLRREHPGLVVQLSDLRPNQQAREVLGSSGLEYLGEPLSALSVPAESQAGIRTMFTGLHHFGREELKEILTAAQRDGVGFAAFEATERSARGLLLTLVIPLLVLLFMPRVRPARFLPLLLTYLPPVLPVLIWWDGLASSAKSYSAAELRQLIAEIEDANYAWVVEEVPSGGPIPLLQVIGHPVPASN